MPLSRVYYILLFYVARKITPYTSCWISLHFMSCPALFPLVASMFIFFAPFMYRCFSSVRVNIMKLLLHLSLKFSSGTCDPLSLSLSLTHSLSIYLSISLWLPVQKSSSCWFMLLLFSWHIFGWYALFVYCLFFFRVSLLFFVVLPLSSYVFARFDIILFLIARDSFSRCHCFVLSLSSVMTLSIKPRILWSEHLCISLKEWKQPQMPQTHGQMKRLNLIS